jgi:hypothetical protein
LGKDSYFWGVLEVLLVLAPVLLVLVLCFDGFEVFLAFGAVVLFWSVAGLLWLAGAGVCPKVSGRLAAAKTMASKLFFMSISPCGLHLSRNSIFRQRPF